MGPVRGFRKRKKTDKKHEDNASASGSPEEGPLDWWDEFSRRINGTSCLRLLFFLIVLFRLCYVDVIFDDHSW